ncbi:MULTISPECIES: hypothetical protein [unclassified Symbiopectobacterium]|uniref:hypothetical protein n=1 Tax=unclassified Symbiopectobacterium TaxID=2794573 RepID=UPI002225D33E|nr:MULTISPECIES: hypothetical protein [unclassified Symbiopectobacterium]MCW2473506.1 hypothetical protein [Candidatus Symbiopectobacterium sp. NZEC151]MCW2483102.1 hypothetical protein [Candidatus Symbiopectobacterium sp. NZEC135]MCW2484607.1 hypothetical protein [Candidatus Symbiopectobacterium sp. NZEC127]
MSINPLNSSGNIPIQMEGKIYFSETGGQSLAGIVKYTNFSEPFERRQIVLTGKFLESEPPVLGNTVVDFKTLHGLMFIFDIYSTLITYADFVIQDSVIQIRLFQEYDPNGVQILHTVINGELATPGGDPIYHRVRSTESLTVAWGQES